MYLKSRKIAAFEPKDNKDYKDDGNPSSFNNNEEDVKELDN